MRAHAATRDSFNCGEGIARSIAAGPTTAPRRLVSAKRRPNSICSHAACDSGIGGPDLLVPPRKPSRSGPLCS